MPSSKKTPNVLLNRWLGSDKPKKDDFNEDNEILDYQLGDLRGQVEQANAAAQSMVGTAKTELTDKITQIELDWSGMLTGARTALEGQISDTQATLEGKISTAQTTWEGKLSTAQTTLSGQTTGVQTNLNTHINTAAIHVTQAQKDAWGSSAPVIGAYSGDGSASRKITLSFTPRFGIVFTAGQPAVKAMWSTQSGNVYAAFFTNTVLAGGISAVSGGFTVLNTAIGSDGFAYRLNESGYSYAYVVWQ